jgi:asparagine synthase (glutamine-hydrolysing)
MTTPIAHPGLDDSGIEWFHECRSGLGHRRLSIIDLSHLDHQPMCSHAGSLPVAYSEEVDEHREIRNKLTEKGSGFALQNNT